MATAIAPAATPIESNQASFPARIGKFLSLTAETSVALFKDAEEILYVALILLYFRGLELGSIENNESQPFVISDNRRAGYEIPGKIILGTEEIVLTEQELSFLRSQQIFSYVTCSYSYPKNPNEYFARRRLNLSKLFEILVLGVNPGSQNVPDRYEDTVKNGWPVSLQFSRGPEGPNRESVEVRLGADFKGPIGSAFLKYFFAHPGL